MPTIADLYRDRTWADFARLAGAIARSGPVVLDGAIISATERGLGWMIEADSFPALDRFARLEHGGFFDYDRAKVPPDDVIAKLWGLPLAKDVEVDDERKETWRDRSPLL